MSRKPETVFTQGIHRHLPPVLYRVKMNNPYAAGLADVWYSGDKSDLWVEYKYLPRVPQRGAVVPTKLLSELQLDWINQRHAEGRNVAVVIGCPSGGVVLTDRAWMSEIAANDFANRVQSRPQLADWILSQTLQSTTR